LNMSIGKNINSDELEKVTGGIGDTGIIGMDSYASKRTACPSCGAKDLKDKEFVADDKKTLKKGQLCSGCGYSWLIGK